MKKIKGFCLIVIALFIVTTTNVGTGIGSKETISSIPVVVVVAPEEGATYATPEIALAVTADGNLSNFNWSYRLNGGENISFSPADYANDSTCHNATVKRTARIKLTASEGANRVEVYARDKKGNGGRAAVSFFVRMNTTPQELSGQSQEEEKISAKKAIEVEVKSNASITNLNNQENCTVNVSLAGNETVNERAKMRIEMRSGDTNVVDVLVENSTGNVENTALFFVTVPEEGLNNGIQLDVHVNDSLMNRSDWLNMTDFFSFDGYERVRLTINASDLMKLYMAEGNVNAINATISFIEGTSTSKQTVETVTTASGLTVLPTDVWISGDKDIVLEVNADELLSAWSQWGKMYENFSYTGNGSMRLKVNTSDLVKIFAGGGAGNNAKTTISIIMDTSVPGIKVETDTTAPEITVLTPEQGQTYTTREIELELKADEPVSNWSYRQNKEGENITFSPQYSGTGSVLMTLEASEGTNTVEIFAMDNVGNRGKAEVSFYVDTTVPEITILTPEQGEIYVTKEIQVEAEANEPVSDWCYKLNGEAVMTFTPVETGNRSKIITLISESDMNIVEISAMDVAGNRGKAVVSFVVMEPRIIDLISVDGRGDILIDKAISDRTTAIEVEERIIGVTGPDGAYTIDSLDALSKSQDYHHSASVSFSGNALVSEEKYKASQGGIGATHAEKNKVTQLQKQGTVSIKTTDNKQSYNTVSKSVFSGRRETEIEWSTPTEEIKLNQMLDGNCTAQMNLTFTE